MFDYRRLLIFTHPTEKQNCQELELRVIFNQIRPVFFNKSGSSPNRFASDARTDIKNLTNGNSRISII